MKYWYKTDGDNILSHKKSNNVSRKKSKEKQMKINTGKLSCGLAGSCGHQKFHLNLSKAGNTIKSVYL